MASSPPKAHLLSASAFLIQTRPCKRYPYIKLHLHCRLKADYKGSNAPIPSACVLPDFRAPCRVSSNMSQV